MCISSIVVVVGIISGCGLSIDVYRRNLPNKVNYAALYKPLICFKSHLNKHTYIHK